MLPVFSIFKIKSLNFLLAFFYFLRYTYSRSAGVMELADVVDSKSHSSIVTTSAEVLDFSRKFDNSICK